MRSIVDLTTSDAWAILIASLSSVSCSLVGCFLVLRRLSMLGDAISHAVLPGIVISYLLTGQIGGGAAFMGAIILALLTTFLTQLLHRQGQLAEDSSMGVVFTTLFSIGVLLTTWHVGRAHLDVDCVLFGILELTGFDTVLVNGLEVPRAILTLAPAALATLLFITLFWKELKITAFDPALATAIGLSATIMHYSLMAMVALVTVASFEAVGSILVIAMLITPPSTGHLLTDRLSSMVVIAAVVALLSSVIGYLGALALNVNAAGMMAVVAGCQFLLAVLFAPNHGFLAKALRRLKLRVRINAEDILGRLYREEEQLRKGRSLAMEGGRISKNRSSFWVARRWLASKELVEWVGGDMRLTESGRRQAADLIRAHRLWESYLAENLDLPRDHLHAPAERMEHFLGPELLEEVMREMPGHPRDPHGHVIPLASSI